MLHSGVFAYLTQLSSLPSTSHHHSARYWHGIRYPELEVNNPDDHQKLGWLGVPRVFSQSTMRRKWLYQHHSQTFLLFLATTCLCLILPYACSFLPSKQKDPSIVSQVSQQIPFQNRIPSAVFAWSYEKIQNIHDWRHSVPAHITWYLHISFCCLLSHLGQKSNQAEGAVIIVNWKLSQLIYYNVGLLLTDRLGQRLHYKVMVIL